MKTQSFLRLFLSVMFILFIVCNNNVYAIQASFFPINNTEVPANPKKAQQENESNNDEKNKTIFSHIEYANRNEDDESGEAHFFHFDHKSEDAKKLHFIKVILEATYCLIYLIGYAGYVYSLCMLK